MKLPRSTVLFDQLGVSDDPTTDQERPASAATSSDENERLAREHFDRVWNQGEFDTDVLVDDYRCEPRRRRDLHASAGRPRDTDDMAQLVQANRGLDFEAIADEFRTQIPLNTGRLERDLLTGAPENHPVIAFERAVLSLPMTLPAEFTAVIEREADRVYAEFEAFSEIGDGVSVAALTELFTARGRWTLRLEVTLKRS